MVTMEKIIAFIFQNQLLVLIIVALLLLTIAEAGFHRGMKLFVAHDEKRKAQISGVHGAVLGMLGLLLGFTFSMAVSRYENRRDLVLQEANAIGTASSKSKRNGEREASDKSFKIFKRERVVTPLPF